jgi:hypothetical protein
VSGGIASFTIKLFPITLHENSKVEQYPDTLDHIQFMHCAASQGKQTDGTMHPNVAVAAMLDVIIESTLL